MNNLLIFNEVSLTKQRLNKEIKSSMMAKVLPHHLNETNSNKNNKSVCWKNIGECIHRGGILTEIELLGEYLLRISNLATNFESHNKN